MSDSAALYAPNPDEQEAAAPLGQGAPAPPVTPLDTPTGGGQRQPAPAPTKASPWANDPLASAFSLPQPRTGGAWANDPMAAAFDRPAPPAEPSQPWAQPLVEFGNEPAGPEVGQAIRKVGNAFVQGLGDGWMGGQIVKPGLYGLDRETADSLAKWASYPEVKKGQETALQAFNETFTFPAIQHLAEAAALNARVGVSVAQVPLQLGSALFRGVTEATAEIAGRDIAGMLEMEGIGGGVTRHIPAPREVPGAPVTRVPVEPEPHPAVTALREPFPPAEPPVPADIPMMRITPDFIEQAREQGVIGPQSEWDGTSVLSSARPEAGIEPGPIDAPTLARQIDPAAFEEYDRLRATHDLALQELRDETARATREVAESAPHTAELADIGARLNEIEALPNDRNVYRERNRLLRRQEMLRAEREDYLSNQDLPGLVLSSPENVQLRDFIADNARKLIALEPRVRDVYAEARRRLPEEPAPAPEISPPERPPLSTNVEDAGDMLRERPLPDGWELGTDPKNPDVWTVYDDKDNIVGTGATPTEAVQVGYRAAESKTSAPAAVRPPPIDIAAHVTDRLVAAGRPPEEAGATAALVQAYFDTRAARTGRDASDLYQELGPDIVGRPALGRGASGSLSEVNGRSVLTLAAKADPSTAVHEFGHMWTRQLLRDAAADGADAAVKADAATVRNWLGAPEIGDLTRNQHERIARGFENYLRTGAAPSERLAGVFAQFKEWLAKVYETLKSRGTPINDDIKGVFDRWLATPDEHATIAPEPSGPPRVRSVAEIMAEDNLSPARAQARNMQEIVALADWQAAHPEAVAALREARRKPGVTVTSEPVAEPVAEAAPEPPRPIPGAEPERVPGVAQNFGPEVKPPPAKAFIPVPREPMRLVEFLKQGVRINEGSPSERIVMRGLRPEPGGEQQLAAVVGGDKFKRGRERSLVNPRDGEPLDAAGLRAEQAGYFPQGRPTINELYEAIGEDLADAPRRYSMHDDAAVAEFERAMRHNDTIAEAASRAGIPLAEVQKMTMDEFNAAVEKALGEAGFDEETNREKARALDSVDEMHDDAAQFEEGRHTEEEFDVIPLAALEQHWREGEAASGLVHGADPGGEPGVSGGPEAEVQPNGAAGGAGAGNAGPSGEAGAGGAEPGPAIKPEPLRVTEPSAGLAELRARRRAEVPKIANVRLEYIDEERWDDLAREVAAQLELSGDPRVQEGSLKAITLHAINNAALDGWDTAKAKWQGAPTTDNLIAMEQAKGRAAAAFENLSAGLTDWGKTGNQWQKIIRASKRRIADIAAGNPDEMTLFQRQTEIAMLDGLDTPEQVGHALAQDYLSPWDKFTNGVMAFYLSNILSGPVTHAGYAIANVLTNLVHGTVTVPAQVGFDIARSALTGAERTVMAGEAKSFLFGLANGTMKAIAPGLRAARSAEEIADAFTNSPVYRALKTGEAALEGGGVPQPYVQQILPNLLGGWAGYALEFPLRAIRAIHVLNYSMRYTGEISRLAYKSALEGLPEGAGDMEFGGRIQQYLNNIPAEDMAYAHDEATRAALMKRPEQGSVGQKVSTVINAVPGGRFIVPFPQIGMNLFEEGIVNQTPLGVFSSHVREQLNAGGRMQSIAAGRMIAGTGIATGVAALALNGLITGPGPDRTTPEGRAQARLLEQEGWAPYSFRFGNTYVPFRKALGPLGELLGVTSSLADAYRAGAAGDLKEAAWRVRQGFSEAVLDETWLHGLHDFFEAATRPDDKLPYYLTNIATGFIPYSQFNSQIARQIDPGVRAAHGLLERAQNKIPFASESLHPVIGPWGQPVLGHSTMGPHTFQADPVSQHMLDLGMGVKAFERKLKGVEMDGDEQERYGRLAGTLAHQLLLPMVTGSGFSGLPRGMQMKQIESVISLSRQNAEQVIQAGNPQKFIMGGMTLKQQMTTTGRGAPPAAPYVH